MSARPPNSGSTRRISFRTAASGKRAQPGDILRGDADGVVVIPNLHEDAVLDTADRIHEAEQVIRDACRTGMRLDEARHQFKYHQLQSRAKP